MRPSALTWQTTRKNGTATYSALDADGHVIRGADPLEPVRPGDANLSVGTTDHSSEGDGSPAAASAESGDRPLTSGGGSDQHAAPTSGEVWSSVDGVRGRDTDPPHGEPLAQHGRLSDAYTPPPVDSLPPQVRVLVDDPGAPYGRDADGAVFTRADWESRFLDVDNDPIYPGNDGAMPGTRVEYTDVDVVLRDHGGSLDRFGGDRGEFLATTGTSFEERALPGSSLNQAYRVFDVGSLPDGFRIEVSRVAPTFGQPGGGVQVRFFDENGAVRIAELLKQGVLLLWTPGSSSRTQPDEFAPAQGLIPCEVRSRILIVEV